MTTQSIGAGVALTAINTNTNDNIEAASDAKNQKTFSEKMMSLISVRNISYVALGFLAAVGGAGLATALLSRGSNSSSLSNNVNTTIGNGIIHNNSINDIMITNGRCTNVLHTNSPYRGYNKTSDTETNKATTNKYHEEYSIKNNLRNGFGTIVYFQGESRNFWRLGDINDVILKANEKFIKDRGEDTMKHEGLLRKNLTLKIYENKNDYYAEYKKTSGSPGCFDSAKNELVTYINDKDSTDQIATDYYNCLQKAII